MQYVVYACSQKMKKKAKEVKEGKYLPRLAGGGGGWRAVRDKEESNQYQKISFLFILSFYLRIN